jgi:hypothetical protein
VLTDSRLPAGTHRVSGLALCWLGRPSFFRPKWGAKSVAACQAISPQRPEAVEFLPYFGQYIDLAPDGDLFTILVFQAEQICAALGDLEPALARTRPSVEVWSPLDVAVHLIDTERVLAFRAFTFARNPGAELPSVDFEQLAEAARANERRIPDVIAELRAVRAATLASFQSFGAADWTNRGIASDAVVSVRALAWIIAGHDLHHLPDLISARN